MRFCHRIVHAIIVSVLSLAAFSASAADPTLKDGDFVLRDFRFHTGETLAELRLHYTTLGNSSGPAVLVLHGTAGSGASMLTPDFAGELFGPGQPLDAAKYFIILPDAIGTGHSAKPSDGLRAKFPRYNYDDIVQAQYRLLTEGLGVKHLRLVMGNSMGGMLTWVWGEAYPGMMDGLVPLASQPSAMSGRNWMLRRMLVESIKSDPDYKNGNYTTQPRSMHIAETFYGIATSGGTMAIQASAPTRAAADGVVDRRLAAPSRGDANDTIWQWDSSRDYDAEPGLARITAPVLAINSADDERNPPETGLLARDIKKVANGRVYLIAASTQTRGHGTTGNASFWAPQLQQFLESLPRK